MWSEAKLSARDQLIGEQVILKLLVDRRFHHLANDAQQGKLAGTQLDQTWNLSCELG